MLMQTSRPMDLNSEYKPCAIYFEDADMVEYVRADVPCVYRRVDEFLTLAYDIFSRDTLVGFQLKGFKHFYLSQLKPSQDALHADFLPMVTAVEKAIGVIGDKIFDAEKRSAYSSALKMASEDGVTLYDLPERKRATG